MSGRITAFVLAGALLGAASQRACAMSSPEAQRDGCRVVGGEKLPSASGGPDALCAAIEQAISAQEPGLRYEAEIRVLSASMLSAKLRTADGRQIPEQRHVVMDRVLTRSSFERFARALATELAKGARQ